MEYIDREEIEAEFCELKQNSPPATTVSDKHLMWLHFSASSEPEVKNQKPTWRVWKRSERIWKVEATKVNRWKVDN